MTGNDFSTISENLQTHEDKHGSGLNLALGQARLIETEKLCNLSNLRSPSDVSLPGKKPPSQFRSGICDRKIFEFVIEKGSDLWRRKFVVRKK